MQAILFFSSRRRHTRLQGDWSSDVCSSDLYTKPPLVDPVTKQRNFASRTDPRTIFLFNAESGLYSYHMIPEEEIGRAHVELQSPCNLVCRLLLEKKKNNVIAHKRQPLCRSH